MARARKLDLATQTFLAVGVADYADQTLTESAMSGDAEQDEDAVLNPQRLISACSSTVSFDE